MSYDHDEPFADPADLDLDPDLGDAMRHAAGSYRPDTRGLVADGHRRGRRMRRRRTAVAAAAVAAVGAAGLGGLVAATSGSASGGPAAGTGVAGAPRPAASATPLRTPHHPPMNAHQVEAVFLSLLPPQGKVSGVTGRGTEEGIPYAHVVYDDGHGKAAIEAGAQREGQVPDCPSPNPDPTTSCHLTHVKGGTLMIFQGWEYPDHRAQTKDWMAEFRTASGALVSVSEWNAPQEKDAGVTRPNPPLSPAQLAAIVTSPAWQRVIDALPIALSPKDVPGKQGSAAGKDTKDDPAGKGAAAAKGTPPAVR
ncbi:hypothetical protein [Actinacidiphila acididurans]|uniref:Lipoprotein n=1 Tax=Actinacidiphila acididurans TaxID=2784346 RepID=A0ABS2TQ93_9ACTN|nr:hypothetical protein [Actinacidiphila acididurans]MBM9505242.1 hypothetical protein [Actinacidiphila acididurans]